MDEDPKPANASAHEPSDPPPDAKAPERYFNFLGLVIVRKADILAATAFILAGASTSYQIGSYLLGGAKVQVFPPDKVYIYFDRYSNGDVITRFAGQVTLTNTGQIGRSAITRDVRLDTKGLGEEMTLHWNSFPKITRHGAHLTVELVDDAFPLQVPGEGTVTKLVSFAPWRVVCKKGVQCDQDHEYVSDVLFMRRLVARKEQMIRLSFTARSVPNDAQSTATCEIYNSDEMRAQLAENDWFLAYCSPVTQ